MFVWTSGSILIANQMLTSFIAQWLKYYSENQLMPYIYSSLINVMFHQTDTPPISVQGFLQMKKCYDHLLWFWNWWKQFLTQENGHRVQNKILKCPAYLSITLGYVGQGGQHSICN